MLKALMLRKKIEEAEKRAAELKTKLEERKTREAELEQAITEAQTEEERATVTEAVQEYENGEEEAKAAESETASLAEEVERMKAELAALEEKQTQAQAAEPTERKAADTTTKRKEDTKMLISKRFKDYTREEKLSLISGEEFRSFITALEKVTKRAVTGLSVTIPEVMTDPIFAEVYASSKLANEVNLQVVEGIARTVIGGTIPEAVWTEQCGTLNELAFALNDVEVDAYKLGGFFDICNAALADNAVNLAQRIISVLGQSLAKTLDKTIIYGTGTKMPEGVITSLAQTSEPAGYPDTARAWADLHTSNVITIANTYTGKALFQQIIKAAKATKNSYSSSNRIWVMNENTKSDLIAEALEFNAAGVLVGGINDTMPGIGGKIVIVDDVPDNNIIVGYFKLYALAQRAGIEVKQSEHYHFVEDKTTFKGTARYDGKPAIREAFAVIGIDGTAPTTSVNFAADSANP